MYLLDTNHCSRIIQGEPSVIARLGHAGELYVSTCVIVAGELRFMANKSSEKERNRLVINDFLRNIKIYPIDKAVADIYGDYKFQLYNHFGPKEKAKREQTRIHKLGFSENDLWIAAIAKRNDSVIVSSDGDFRRMSEVLDLNFESWYLPL